MTITSEIHELVRQRAHFACEFCGVTEEETRLLTRYRGSVQLLEQLNVQLASLVEEQRQLLEEQRRLLRLFLNRKG